MPRFIVTLSERFARFDVGLSAVGVGHRPDGEWSVMVHPLALESVLLKPLVNWKYVLTTLEWMRTSISMITGAAGGGE